MLRRTLSKGKKVSPKKKPVTKKTTKMSAEEIRNLIAKRAYEIYASRDFNVGDQNHDWLMAEKQVKQELRVS